MKILLLYALALGAGVSVATQQVLNGSLRTALESPAWAGLISYAGGLLTMIVAVTLDHFGAFGLTQHPIGTARLMGAAFLIAGVVLIRD